MSPAVPIPSPAARSAEQPCDSVGLLWSGRIFTALVVLSENLIVASGVTLLLSTILRVIPRTSILPAIRLNGFLGGAVSIQLRVGIRSSAERCSRFILACWYGLDCLSAKPACALVLCEVDLIPADALGKKESLT